jgi:hypothetical protein
VIYPAGSARYLHSYRSGKENRKRNFPREKLIVKLPDYSFMSLLIPENQALKEIIHPGWSVKILRPNSFFLINYFIYLLFICTYNAWVISPPCPHPSLTIHPTPSLSPHTLDTWQKLFCPYL